MQEPHSQAYLSFNDVEASGSAVRPLDFPPPNVKAGVRVNALVVHPETGSRQVCSGVIHREDLSEEQLPPEPLPSASAAGAAPGSPIIHNSIKTAPVQTEVLAYWPQRRLQDAIYGSVWASTLR